MKATIAILLALSAAPAFAQSEPSDASIDRAVRETLTTEAVVDYLLCTMSKTPTMDDRISDAATVAAGLHGVCRTSFSKLENFMSFDEVERLAMKARPKVIQQVLENRARQNPQKTPPAVRQFKPTT